MEATDVADQLGELAEELPERAARRRTEVSGERFRRGAALAIAVLAMLLAINSVGGANAGGQEVNNNIQASDTWAFYQAKNIRQTSLRVAADELELLLPLLPPEQRAEAAKRIDGYKEAAARYESEPDPADPANPLKGEGKKELSAQARGFEAKRERAQSQGPNFDLAGALFQIGIVLGSVAVLAMSRPILGLGLASGAVATALMANGFFLWFELPIA